MVIICLFKHVFVYLSFRKTILPMPSHAPSTFLHGNPPESTSNHTELTQKRIILTSQLQCVANTFEHYSNMMIMQHGIDEFDGLWYPLYPPTSSHQSKIWKQLGPAAEFLETLMEKSGACDQCPERGSTERLPSVGRCSGVANVHGG